MVVLGEKCGLLSRDVAGRGNHNTVIDILYPVKLLEKPLICGHSLLCVHKTYLTPLLTGESVSRGHNILYLKRRISVRRTLGILQGSLPADH
jgi:hypothetical protein